MLYNLLYPLHDHFSILNIFRYITFRASMAAVTAFTLSLIFGPWVISKLKEWKVGEKVIKKDSLRLDELQRTKQSTPTMGGIFILVAVVFSTLLWADLSNRFIHLVLFGTIWLGITGFIDDYLKLKKPTAKGMTATAKLISQCILGIAIGTFLYFYFPEHTKLEVPFLKNVVWELGILYVLFVLLVITGTSNAVNLTDGLDGLAIGCVIMVSLAFVALSYVTGNTKFSEYLLIPYVRNSGELAVFCSAIFGAGLGFLWFNCYPATIFMGDVGSLSLGGALGIVALLIKKELLLIIVGGVFVVEALSVIMQVASFRFFKKRIFKIAPLHHHFQFLGWPESKVIVRFWIVAILLALITVATLKIR